MNVNIDPFGHAWIQEFRDVHAKIEAIPASPEQTAATVAFGELHDKAAARIADLEGALALADERAKSPPSAGSSEP